MKKTVGVLSLIVMLLSQIITPFTYAVSGEVEEPTPVIEEQTPEPVEEESVPEPEEVEPVVIPEVENSVGGGDIDGDKSNSGVVELLTGDDVEVNGEPEVFTGMEVEVNTGTTVSTGEETKNLEEEVLTGTEASSGFIEKITESIKNFLGINGEENEENFESREIYGTGEYEGVKVEVYAQTGLFASGTELTIEPVVEEKLEAVQEVLLSGKVDLVNDEEKQTIVAFDITFIYSGEEVQPLTGTVQVTFNYENNEYLKTVEKNEEQEVKIYHLNDKNEEGGKIEEITGAVVEEVVVNKEKSEENKIVVETNSFSIYMVGNIGLTLSSLGDVITYSYNANGGTFEDGDNVRNIVYNYSEPAEGIKYSHTPNISDAGVKNEDYGDGLSINEVITIDGAEKLDITIIYGGESENRDWACMWEGSHPNYTAQSDYKTSVTGKLGGGNHTNPSNTKKFTVRGNTVTFAFRSDGSGCGDGYGYYAIIKGIGGYTTNEIIENPTRSGFGFAGWFESGSTELFDFNQDVTQNRNLYAKWDENIHIKYNANGGYFNDGNMSNEIDVEYSLQSNGAYASDVNLQFPSRVSEDINQQSGWMFAGWYTTEGEASNQTTEFVKVDGTTQNNMIVYAKWLPFNDFPIMNGEEILFIIMDRNLGATEIFNQNFENPNTGSYGLYYQWGNNYGFSSNPDSVIEIIEDGIDASANGPGNYYYSNVFVKGSSWDSSNNKNLWGGSGDDKLIRGDGTDENRQGPCPEGYHVPSAIEWEYAYSTRGNMLTRSQGLDLLSKNFGYDFMLPFAGNRGYSSSNVSNQGNGVSYWSSSPRDNSNYASYYLVFGKSTPDPFVNSQDRTRGFPVRCFKNSLDRTKKVVFFTETGYKVSEYDLIRWEPVISGYMPENPIKKGYEFIGRYESGSDEEYDFSQERVDDLTLYEKWAPIEGTNEGDTAKLVKGTKFNTIIKSLVVGETISYKKKDILIKGIERSSVLPEGGSKRLISDEDSEAQVFAWYDSTEQIIKYYTNAETIYLNEDSSYMFSYLKNLRGLNLDDFKADYVVNMEQMFANSFVSAEGLMLDFTNLNLSNVTNMRQMFYQIFQDSSNSGIVSGVVIDFSNVDLGNVLDMYQMFCFSFQKTDSINGVTIDFSNADMGKVSDMYQMFGNDFRSNAGGIQGIKIDFNHAHLQSVENMQYMFNGMVNSVALAVTGVTIDLSNVELDSVTNMKNMFQYSFEYNRGRSISGVTINLSNIVVQHDVDITDIFTNTFYSNSSLINGVSIDISNTNLSGWKNMGGIFRYAFSSNGGIKGFSIIFSKSLMDDTSAINNMFEGAFSRVSSGVEGVIIDFSDTSMESLSDMSKMFYQSFQEAGDISGVTVNFDGADLNNLENMKEMFSSSFSRSRSVNGITIDFGNLSLENLEDMSYMFSYSFQNVQSLNCINIDFNNKNFVSLTNMSKMFVNAFYSVNTVSGINIDFSNSFLGNVINMDEFFSYTFSDVNIISGVTIDFSNTDLHNLTSISNLIYNSFRRNSKNSSLISDVKLDFSNVDFSSVTNVQNLFYGTFQSFHSMTGIMIDFSNTDLSSVKNAKWMFQYSIGYSDSIDNVIMDFSNVDLSSLTSANQMFYQTFYNITDVGSTTIKFDNINMHNITDMYGMFYRGEALKWLDLSSFDTSNVTDMTYMFYDCSNLTGLDLSSFDTSNVTKMPYMFQDDYNLKTIYVGSRFRTNNVTDSSVMFQNANSLVGGRGTTYDSSNPRDKTYARVDKVGEPGYFTKKGEGTVATLLPGQEFNAKIKTMAKGSSAAYGDADVYIKRIKRGTRDQLLDLWLQGKTYETLSTTYSEEPVNAWYDDATKTIYYYTIADEIDMNTNASNMFSNLTKLEEVELEGINTNSVSNMTSLFQNDTSLTGMDLSNFDASSVTSMQNMFNGCSGIKSINLSNANMSRVTNISGIFGGCSSLETVDFSNADIRSLISFASIFPGLPKLREVNFHKVNLSSLETTSGMFGGISSLKYADFSDTNLKSVQSVVSMFGGTGLTGVDFSNADLRNAESAYSMFGGVGTLLMANFENVNMSNLTNMESIFGGCSNLNWVTFSGANIGNVTSVFSMFGGDSKLETVDFTEVNLSKLENMSSMFGGCSGLTGMDFSKMDLSRVTNMDGLFSAALKLESVNFGDNDFRNVTNMRSLFRNCGNLEELDITKFDTRNVTNMSEMFYGVANLKTIYVGDNFKTDSVTNSTDMFDGAVSLVGGNGTTYDESKIDKEYAVADVEGTPGYFTNIIDKKYTITYHLEGGELTGERTTYTERTNVYVLPQPTKEGYTFEGWIGSNGSTPEVNVSLEGMKGDLEFTAKWKVIVPDPEPTPSGNTGGGGGGSSNNKKVIDNQPTEKEHESADDKQETKQDEQLKEQEKEQTKTPEKTNTTPNQTSTQQSSSNNTSTKTVTVDPEIQSAYEWAYAHNVTTMPTLGEANPEGVVTRGHLAKMVVNYATNVLGQEIPEKIPSECRWNDWRGDWESEEIKDYAVKSCALGLMGLDMDKFLPNMQVTRAQFGTIMSRLLWGKKYAGGTPYYRKHLNALKENNIMTQIDNPERRVELRQWVWVMLMRSAQNK